jgi:phage-related protein
VPDLIPFKRMNKEFIREIFYYENHYLDFFATLRPEVQKKFNYTLQLIATIDRIPEKYFKYMINSSGIYEIRVEVGSNIYRVFSFFDKGNLIILVNGFQKKTQKTPQKELELAEHLKKQYYNEQKNKK